MSESKPPMKELIADLAATRDQISKYIGTHIRAKLPPGASAEAIMRFEQERGIVFPPSYRKFLALYNGWVNFLGTYTLIGVSGPHTQRALKAIDKVVKKFVKCWLDAGRSTEPESIAAYESKGRKNAKTLESARIYLPNRLVFGIDSEDCLLLFDERDKGRDGEMKVLETSPEGNITDRFDSFENMLGSYRDVLHRRLDMYRKLDEEEQKKRKRRE